MLAKPLVQAISSEEKMSKYTGLRDNIHDGVAWRRRTRNALVCSTQVLAICALVLFFHPQIWNGLRFHNSQLDAPSYAPSSNGVLQSAFLMHLRAKAGRLGFNREDVVSIEVRRDHGSGYIQSPVYLFERLNKCHYSWNVTGTLHIVRGEPDQLKDFMVGIQASASSPQALDSMRWTTQPWGQGFGLFVNCVDFSHDQALMSQLWNASVRLDMALFVKPHIYTVGDLSIDLETLDIDLRQDLWLQAYHIDISTRHGNVVGAESGLFNAHDIPVISDTGSITGNWRLPAKLEVQANGHNASSAGIDINVIVPAWTNGPWTPGELSARTDAGCINITMISDNSEPQRNFSIDIHSNLGNIAGWFFTGSETTLSTAGKGSIDATFLPRHNLPERSTISTSTMEGNTDLRVLPPIISDFYRINAMNITSSSHQTASGHMSLSYPAEWDGTAVGLSETGSISIAGSSFSTLIEAEHCALARTKNAFASRLDFDTVSGNASFYVDR